ncbi:MAG: cryptochrome/photolyase family protein [Deltaproteobacteria bacterium]|nr:cryptochrome/photolyase family protein [Deltaproteobacteria bacterium]
MSPRKKQKVLLLFPHQLFRELPEFDDRINRVVLVEDGLFFGDSIQKVQFHKQKIWLHRASMVKQAERLRQTGMRVDHVEHRHQTDPLSNALESLHREEVAGVTVIEPHDYLLNRRLRRHCNRLSIEIDLVETPMFLTTSDQNNDYRASKKGWRMADYYKFQRRRLDLLMEDDEPTGGSWSFDADNRKKIPKNKLGQIPELPDAQHDEVDLAARDYVLEHYPQNPGSLDQLIYPTSHESAQVWFSLFLKQRFSHFGDYEDAIVQNENWLWHSVLTPMMNIGLLTPAEVIQETVRFAEENEIPLNSLEGFVRQIVGWREFMRATYEDLGRQMRTTNHWGHRRKIPQSFYDGTTGITPVDDVIHRVLNTGYCHHIERLMVLGGFMFVCEFDPDEIYQWFMELFIDSYDWVMVPNVYAMSQNADGGLITTKPYFSGSSYIRKMSHYSSGEWAATWDGLYWRWIWNHVDELGKNPRWSMMCAMARKMDSDKREAHLQNAETFLSSL